ncbi:TetR/AcrR family transcriptional regulator [Comamonas kerstersii]|uniref:TetR/AcrR family transcriptional regulator n=1 Tax=Comamonas kerstersii TaxID=225992 RepID=A0A6A1R4A6_9BURK|nr:TetR/AcrR family transcriptional regulator [Comamonas kerstersii]KAB0587453.1 TetR/AcrR family transcriptional regulator [Comamonas kerstersii]
MGRKPSIEKTQLLEAAEQIIRTRGAAALSFDAIAKMAGVSKGGVQGAFGSKEALIHALFEYLDGEHDALFKASVSRGASAVDAYVDAVLSVDSSISQRVASLSLAITQEPESRTYVKSWYAETFQGLSAETIEGRAEILKLCALEGAMMMKSMQLLPLTEAEWASVLAELKNG